MLLFEDEILIKNVLLAFKWGTVNPRFYYLRFKAFLYSISWHSDNQHFKCSPSKYHNIKPRFYSSDHWNSKICVLQDGTQPHTIIWAENLSIELRWSTTILNIWYKLTWLDLLYRSWQLPCKQTQQKKIQNEVLVSCEMGKQLCWFFRNRFLVYLIIMNSHQGHFLSYVNNLLDCSTQKQWLGLIYYIQRASELKI